MLNEVKSDASAAASCSHPGPGLLLCQGTQDLCAGSGMQLLLSPLQIQLVAKLSACSRDTERNRT